MPIIKEITEEERLALNTARHLIFKIAADNAFEAISKETPQDFTLVQQQQLKDLLGIDWKIKYKLVIGIMGEKNT